MKHLLFLIPLVLLAACNPPPPASATQPCTPVTDQGTVSGSFTPSANFKALDPNKVEVASDQLVVTDNSLTVNAGDLLASNCNDGLLRKVTGVSTQYVGGSGVSTQAIRKVYIQTTDAVLEDAITDGSATLTAPTLQLDDSGIVQSLSGVHAEAVSGKITLKNVSFNVANGVNVTLNGSIQQSLDPKFNLKFSGSKISLFEAGVSGSIGASLQATITTTGKAALAVGTEQQIAKFAPIRSTFAVGVVPVVIVMEPRLVGGASAGSDKAITLNAGIAPTLSFNAGVRYNSASGWSNLYSGKPAFTASLNPTFNFTTPGGAQGQVYAKLVIDVKFYGLVGPSLEVKPFSNIAIAAATPTQASLTGGLNAASKVVAGFKVLGKGMENEYPLSSTENTQQYSCNPNGCNAN